MKTILQLLQQDNLMWGGGKSSYITFPETVCGKVHGQTKGIFYHKPCYYHCQHQHESLVDFPQILYKPTQITISKYLLFVRHC